MKKVTPQFAYQVASKNDLSKFRNEVDQELDQMVESVTAEYLDSKKTVHKIKEEIEKRKRHFKYVELLE